MKLLNRRLPRFRAKVRDQDNKEYTWWFADPNPERIKNQLLKDGLTIVKPLEPYSIQEWIDRCKPYKDQAIAAKNSPGFEYKSDLWTELKQFLFLLSDGCCGYCEARVRVTTKGDVEHYRPKGAVAGESSHPGYYWLAYEFENYIPSCTNCNSSGKGNRFPLKTGSARALDETGVPWELPLLVNPFEEDPSGHFQFVDDSNPEDYGAIVGVDEWGTTSVDVYGLNRYDLRDARRETFRSVRVALLAADNDPRITDEILTNLRAGAGVYAHFSLVVQAAIKRRIDEGRSNGTSPTMQEQLLAEMSNNVKLLLAKAP